MMVGDKMYKGLLIDLGNTIIYNHDFNFEKGLNCLYDHIEKPKISRDEFLDFTKQFTKYTYDNREQLEINFHSFLHYLKVYFQIEFDLSFVELEKAFLSSCERVSLVPGVEEVLAYFYKQNKKIVILSNSTFSSPALMSQLETLKIDHYFTALLSSADNIYRKPSPYFFNLGIKSLNLNHQDVLYIGNDYYYDVMGASNLNLNICWFNENKEENKQNIKCLNITNYFELLQELNTNRE